MSQPATGFVLVLWFSVFSGSACYAQGKKPCDFITKSDAESILGATVEARRDGPYECSFAEPGFTSKAPKNKQVSLSVWYSASPNANDVAVRRKNIADYKAASDLVKDLPGFADAAIWKWTPGWGGTLIAFKGGTIQTEVTISGIPEDAALQNAKTLAAKPLGGSARSGYAYAGAPGSSTQASAAVPVQSPASYDVAWMGQSRVIRGTVSRVSVRFGARPYWLTIFFKESPDAAFVVCSPYPGMFMETVGDLYALVGKTLEVTGQVEGAMCAGKAASIRVVDSQHYRVQAAAGDVAGRPAAGALPAERRASGLASYTGKRARVGLDICNGGKVDLDALLVKQGGVASTHLAPRDCAHVYEENGATPAYVGLAFVDARGQWGAARRQDLLPDFGIGVLTRANQSVPVRHGNTTVSLPMQLLFQPRVPKCARSATEKLSPLATDAERAEARRLDAMGPYCDSLDYTLNAVAYPDTREVTFEKKCFVCPPAPALTELAKQQAIGMISRISPEAGRTMGGAAAQEEEQALKESLKGPPEFWRMNWNEMNLALAKVRPSGGRPPEMPEYLVIRGTVSRVDVSPPGASEHWVNVYFRESSEQESTSYETVYGAFNVCASDAGIFEDIFGPDFRSRMIGQVLDVEGEYQRNYCKGSKGSIRVTLARQVHLGGSGQFATAAGIWVPPPSAAPPVQQEPEMDPGMPSYSLTSKMAGEEILQYCSGIYDPVFPLLTPEQNRIKNANRAAIEAEVKKCASSFDAAEVAPHRRIAMRYCLGHNDYTVAGQGGRIKTYDECMYQNDTLTAFCTRELKYRAELDHMSNVADQKCPAPRPNHREALVIKNGGHDDIGHPVVIPSAGPGLPPILLAPMEPGTIHRAGK